MKAQKLGIVLALSGGIMMQATAAGILAPIQLTNPQVAVTVQGPPAAWVVDENLGVIYCTTVNNATGTPQRVSCIDGNGLIEVNGSAHHALPNPGAGR